MRKSIIIFALLGSNALHASAQSNVTLYGIVDASVEYAGTGSHHAARVDSSNVNASRWGIRGAEDVGGGTKILFMLENGFNVNNGTNAQSNAMFGRTAWVGASGAAGLVQFGLNYTPLHTILVTYSLPGLGLGLGWGNAANNFVFGPVLRANNSIRYTSPSFAGFVVRAFYALGANGSSALPRTLGNTASIGVHYSRGPLSADMGYLTQVSSTTPIPNASSPTSTGGYAVAGVSYDFGFAKAAFVYQTHRGGMNVAAPNPGSYADPKNDFYEVNATFPLGVGSLLASFGQYRKLGDSSGNASSYGLRYDYPLSKRTIIYTGAAYVRNSKSANFTVNGAASPGLTATQPGQNVSSLVVGMLHLF